MDKQIYITGAVTYRDQRITMEVVANLVEEMGYKAYVPCAPSDLEESFLITPADERNMNMRQLEKSSLAIIHVGSPSIGVGMELERADLNHIPIIAIWQEGDAVSRPVMGVSSIKAKIKYWGLQDAREKIKAAIEEINP